ncbi:MAG: hypothetical protein KKA84_11405 [Bacteroidetes bacterium]|nr:hypothetical protein [Bacteroidota bacterium]
MNKVNGFIFNLVIFLFLSSVSLAQSIVSSEIGIKIISGKKSQRTERAALTLDRLRSGDNLQIFLYPEENCLLYLIHSDSKHSSLLLMDSLKSKVLYILPASDSTYTIDGTSVKEVLTVLITHHPIKDVDKFFMENGTSSSEWKNKEDELISESQVMQNEVPGQRISMAGNIRGKSELSLKSYVGKNFLIKTYTFDVKI